MPVRIAFGYKMGVGKDSACSYLCSKFGGSILSFSEPIYNIMFHAQFVCNLEQKKDRRFLQLVGTEWGRNKNPDIWLNLLLEKSQQSDFRNKNLFLSDLRFPNELYRLKDQGWICVRIDRDCSQISKERPGTGSNTHQSECSLDKFEDDEWDYILENNGSLQEFYSSLEQLYSKLNQKKEGLVKSEYNHLSTRESLDINSSKSPEEEFPEKDWLEGET